MYISLRYIILFFTFSLTNCSQNYSFYLSDILNEKGIKRKTDVRIFEDNKELSVDSIGIEKIKDIILGSKFAPEVLGPIISIKRTKVYFIQNGNKVDSLMLFNDEIIFYQKKYYKPYYPRRQ